MKILVDADGCPVKSIIVKIAKEYQLPVVMFSDTSHIIDDGYSKVIVVGKGYNSADFALINHVDKDDIIITQDYGVATMVLSKGAHAINQNGLIYTNDNMDRLLFQRYLSQKVRKAGGKTSNPKKRKKEDNERFESSFKNLIESASI
ncbi:YaiI/YqxD family protein [Wukongibacter baidiensis]|uniref:YaiI/YqxD family protein n=1 Tax=Wukongibacter baidiensis TaxID=1723361 RepID=UPI003D7F3E34